MSGRGRGRPPSRAASEAAAGPSRRSTRHQQQPQNAAQPIEGQPQANAEQQQPQEQQGQQIQQEQAQNLPRQVEAPMSVPEYHANIDPAITGPQDDGMPPPPLPTGRGSTGQVVPQFARRSAGMGASISSSINSVPNSSQSEPPSTAPETAVATYLSGTPVRGLSVLSSAASETPGRRAARAKLMSHMLLPLFNAADELVAHLANNQLDPEIWDVMRTGLKKVFDTYRVHFAEFDSDPVVSPSFVTEMMGVTRASPLWYKTFRIVSGANLAALLDDLSRPNQYSLLPLLQVLVDADFRDVFVGEVPEHYDASLEEQIIEQVLEIRTQLSILTLQELQTGSRGPFHPRAEVARIWCDGDVSLDAIEAFRGNNRDALQLKLIVQADSEAAGLASDRAGTRLIAICNMLPDEEVDGHALDLKELQEHFPINQFLDNLRTFAEDRFGRIKNQLRVERESAMSLAASEATSRADSQIRSQLEGDAMAHAYDRGESGASQAGYDVDALRMMKQLEQQVPAGYDNSIPHSSYAPPPRIPYPPEFISLGFGDSASQSGYGPSGSVYAASAAQVSGRKRGAAETTTATGDGSAASPAPPAKKRVRRKKNAAAEPPVASPSAAAASSLAAVSPPSYPPLPGTQDEPDFEALSARTRELSAASRKAKEPQVRSPWVQKDIRLLVKAVNTYQCKWSTIEREIKAGTIPFERPRDQQALRDKARLLKQDLLKADAVLPRGFDLVVLGKKERKAVEALGKNPDRKEGDVDENGRPFNTEWNGEDARAAAAEPAALPPAEVQNEEQPQPQPLEQQGEQPQQQEAQPVDPERALA